MRELRSCSPGAEDRIAALQKELGALCAIRATHVGFGPHGNLGPAPDWFIALVKDRDHWRAECTRTVGLWEARAEGLLGCEECRRWFDPKFVSVLGKIPDRRQTEMVLTRSNF